jgi:carbamoyl-phosphate synthase large subunit
MHRDVAVCFEINVRFSGTTPVRARLGFNDVEAALEHYILGQPDVDLPLITSGIALRYWNEAYVDSNAVAELDQLSRLEQPEKYHITVEDYGMRK